MASSLQYLKEQLEVIRATTRPIEDNGELDNQWKEVFSTIAKAEKAIAKKGNSGSDNIADKVKEYLDENFPGATLEENVPAENIISFNTENSKYHTIKIEA